MGDIEKSEHYQRLCNPLKTLWEVARRLGEGTPADVEAMGEEKATLYYRHWEAILMVQEAETYWCSDRAAALLAFASELDDAALPTNFWRRVCQVSVNPRPRAGRRSDRDDKIRLMWESLRSDRTAEIRKRAGVRKFDYKNTLYVLSEHFGLSEPRIEQIIRDHNVISQRDQWTHDFARLFKHILP